MANRHARLASELAALGPFFAVERHDPGDPPVAPWRTMADLTGSGSALRDRVTRVRTALAAVARREPMAVDPRIAVSVAHLGVVARLIAPAVGAAALGHGTVPMTVDPLWWQDELGGPFPLSVALVGRGSEPDEPGGVRLTGSAVESITLACRRTFRMSGRVLWGNVASAANSAATLIGGSRPDLVAAARAAADAILSDDRVDDGQLRAGPGFRRRSCCLIYRLAGTGATSAGASAAAVCGDCVLGDPARTAGRRRTPADPPPTQ